MIKVHNLAKMFGAKRAVDDISFSVERGEVHHDADDHGFHTAERRDGKRWRV